MRRIWYVVIFFATAAIVLLSYGTEYQGNVLVEAVFAGVAICSCVWLFNRVDKMVDESTLHQPIIDDEGANDE